MRAIRTLMRHFRNGFRNLFRNGWMTLASIVTMTLTLTMVGGLVFLLMNVGNITGDIEQGVKIRAHIDLAAEPKDEAELKEAIKKVEHVTQVDYSSKEDEYQMLLEQYGDEFKLFGGDNNPLYNVYVVSVDDPNNIQQVAEAIKQLPYVTDASYGEQSTVDLVRTLNIIRAIAAGIAAVMVAIAVLLISNTIRLTIGARSTEIEIMRLVGAKNSFIRAPLMIEGAYIGLISALLASGVVYGGYLGLQSTTREFLGVSILKFAPVYPAILYIAAGLVVFGMILGMIGAGRSAKRYLTI